jgi:translation initiation factor 5B
MTTRSPICTIVGHVDHGKTSLLDKIRGTAITAQEAGKITQAIGASIIPLDTIKEVCGPLLKKLNLNFTIPGLLFIDTPGHAAFTNLRKRGGALADIAVVIIDINEGFKPQTLESIEILKVNKTPFIIAANKVDLIPGWNKTQVSLMESLKQQATSTIQSFEIKLYELVGKLHELGFESERFDRVDDYTKQIAIIPISATTGQGLPELLMTLAGLAQKFLEKNLQLNVAGPARGTILEIKEEQGLGTTIDAIIYDGTLKVNETIVIGTTDVPITTKVRALLEPLPLVEMRAKKANFQHIKQATAATGVKISAPDLDKAVAGMPIRVATKETITKITEEIQQEVKEVLVQTDQEGVIIKADTLGSVEALATLLRDHEIPIKSASIGKITKKDVTEAEAMGNQNPFYGVLIAFNTQTLPEATTAIVEKNIKLIQSDIIYHIIDQYHKWKEEKKKETELAKLNKLVRGGKFKLLPGYVFRQNNPAVVGTEILAGRIATGNPIMNAYGKRITTIKQIQEEKKSITEAKFGKQVSVAMDKVMVGRQINEGDILYTDIPEEDFKKMKALKYYLNKADVELLKEIAEIKRKENITWGI